MSWVYSMLLILPASELKPKLFAKVSPRLFSLLSIADLCISTFIDR